LAWPVARPSSLSDGLVLRQSFKHARWRRGGGQMAYIFRINLISKYVLGCFGLIAISLFAEKPRQSGPRTAFLLKFHLSRCKNGAAIRIPVPKKSLT